MEIYMGNQSGGRKWGPGKGKHILRKSRSYVGRYWTQTQKDVLNQSEDILVWEWIGLMIGKYEKSYENKIIILNGNTYSIRISYQASTINNSNSHSLALAGWRFNCFTERETTLKKRFRIKLYPISQSYRLWISKFYSMLYLLFWSWPLLLFWGASDPALREFAKVIKT